MGIAALILGIVGLIVSFIPFCGMVAFLPCLVGLGLGIADIVVKSRNHKGKAMGIVGTVLNGVALLVAIFWGFFTAIGAAKVAGDPAFQQEIRQKMEEMQNTHVIVQADKKGGTVSITVPEKTDVAAPKTAVPAPKTTVTTK